jgi:anti-sigma regulatory factor (Ser/Thr protein kinase)
VDTYVEQEWRRDFPGVMSSIGAAVAWVESVASDARIDEAATFGMQVCLEELMANVARHGRAPALAQVNGGPVFADDPLKVSVRLNVLPDRVRMTVEDNGRPFDVAQAPARRVQEPIETVKPGGLGVHLIKTFAHSIGYSLTEAGNCVVAEFLR